MQKKPVFHLFIPYLLQPLKSWNHDFNATHLSILLSQYLKINNYKYSDKNPSLDAAFFDVLDSNVEELPIAFYRYQVHTGKEINSLVCADPIHLEVSMNDVTLTEKITDLTDDEAKELLEIFNNHFAQDGLKFIFGTNQSWYVSYPDNETIKSHDFDSVYLTNITDKFIQSKQRNWQVIQNEAQMLLHSSDVNHHREVSGLKPINSLWFWGAGKPLQASTGISKVYSGNGVTAKLRGQMFAKAANCDWQSLSEGDALNLGNDDKKTGVYMVILDQLFTPAVENKLDEYQEQLDRIDLDIIKPLLQSWKKNEIDIVINCCDGTLLKPQKVPAWKFWVKPQKLREIVR